MTTKGRHWRPKYKGIAMKAPDITVKLYIHKDKWSKEFIVSACDMSRDGFFTLVDTREITIPAPQISESEINQKRIDQLRCRQSEIINSAHVQSAEIEDEIKTLQCIEHSPAAITSR